VKKRILFIGLALLLVVSLVAIGCEEEETTTPTTAAPTTPTVTRPDDYDTRTNILIGAARPLSGPLAQIGDFAFTPISRMWVEEVNAAGGIYVEEYDRQLPIEFIEYDDTSDLGTSQRLIEQLILEDEVDFLFPNCSTAFLYASAPLANKYGYVYLGAEGGCTTLTDMLPDLPYVFPLLNYSDYDQIPVLTDIFVDLGVETVALIYINDLHGVEYYHTALSEFTLAGITVLMAEAVPAYATDVELVLKQAQDSEADAFCAFVYPPTCFSVVGQAMAIGYNPDAFVIGPGANFEFFKDPALGGFGEEVVEGIIGFGAFNSESSPEIADFIDRFIARWGIGYMDWWGAAFYWAGLEALEAAIVEAGTLDQDAIRDVLATSHFTTILGDTWFDMTAGGAGGGLLAKECAPGQVAQWQSGIYEVIGPADKMTTDTILYPKPHWPGQ
jgi:branched-chain amino acid transport system substrate-binding protein